MSKESDFIKKAKTITIGTGAKAKAPKCGACGKDMQVVGVATGLLVRHRKKQKSADEHSFTA